jgi:hypothetical protein
MKKARFKCLACGAKHEFTRTGDGFTVELVEDTDPKKNPEKKDREPDFFEWLTGESSSENKEDDDE